MSKKSDARRKAMRQSACESAQLKGADDASLPPQQGDNAAGSGTRMSEDPVTPWTSSYGEILELAEKGNPVAQTMIARTRIDTGIDFVSLEKACTFVEDAAKKGFPPACGLWAYLVARGIGTTADADLSLTFLGKAIYAGDPEAACTVTVQQYLLGQLSGEHLITRLKAIDCLTAAHIVQIIIPLLAVLESVGNTGQRIDGSTCGRSQLDDTTTGKESPHET
ncbi:MAG: hypothetical protein ACOYOU_15670 [Kiritimatiellia bacterium]